MENNKVDIPIVEELMDEMLDAVVGGYAEGDTAAMYCARDCKTQQTFVYTREGYWRCTCCGKYRGSINVFA